MVRRKEDVPEERGLFRSAAVAVFALSIALTVLSAAWFVWHPVIGETYTEFYVLGEKGVASGYPTRITLNNPVSVIIGVGNHEQRQVTYAVECYAANQSYDAIANTTLVHQMKYLGENSFTTIPNETHEYLFTFSLNEPGYNSLVFLLFDGKGPGPTVTGSDRIQAAYQDLRLWVRVEA